MYLVYRLHRLQLPPTSALSLGAPLSSIFEPCNVASRLLISPPAQHLHRCSRALANSGLTLRLSTLLEAATSAALSMDSLLMLPTSSKPRPRLSNLLAPSANQFRLLAVWPAAVPAQSGPLRHPFLTSLPFQDVGVKHDRPAKLLQHHPVILLQMTTFKTHLLAVSLIHTDRST